jgi:hypothetical protein
MKFSGLRPLEPGRGTIDVHVSGFGDVDLRNDCDVVHVALGLTPAESTLQLVFRSVRHNANILIEFLDVRLLEGEYEPLGSVLEADRTLFEDLMYWHNHGVDGFSVETAVAHLVFECSEVSVTAARLS